MGAILLIAALAAWTLLILAAFAVRRAPRREPEFAFAWLVARAHTRLVHRVRFEGLEHLSPAASGTAAEPLIIVANHTAGVDPVLVQVAFPREIRWMMMREMMLAPLAPLWSLLGIIAVEQNGRDTAALRTAIRHLQSGGVIGIFAEGGLERPPHTINPYQPGVGLLALKSKARVLPVVIRGTPAAGSAWAGLVRPSHARVRFLPIRSFAGTPLDATGIALELEAQAARELGWARGPRAEGRGK